MAQTLFEKLQLESEKNLLVQGLPSTIEKQFAKLSFSKNVTPLLKKRKIDFALVFSLNQNQLNNILAEVCPALHGESRLWVAYPKATSKIRCDLHRDCSWNYLFDNGFECGEMVDLDYVWSAQLFTRKSQLANGKYKNGSKRKLAEVESY